MLEVMRCLAEEMAQTPANNKAYRTLQFMVQAKLEALEKGRSEPQIFERSSLLLNVEGAVKAKALKPASWLTPALLERHLESRAAALNTRLRKAGLDQMPVIRSVNGEGGRGNELGFWLDVAPLPSEQGEHTLNRIEYRRTEAGAVKPAWLLCWMFRDGELKNRSWRGLSLFIAVLVGIVLSMIWVFTGLWSISNIDQALTLRQIGVTAFFGVCAWLIWVSFYRPWVRLVDERVVKAPAALLAFWEDSAEIEMHRDSEKQQWIRFVRFSGDCSLCSGRVLLMPGIPEHRQPLVGRCSESPHAHVFSFDRARLEGVYVGPKP